MRPVHYQLGQLEDIQCLVSRGIKLGLIHTTKPRKPQSDAWMSWYRRRSAGFIAAGLTGEGKPRKNRNLNGQSTADPTAYHREYMRQWRAAKRISASQQTYPTVAGTSAPPIDGVEG